ncbi:MAG: 16S rRNA (adenine(1518)-N(6)/adenine(1519)-N(6))-dimethyltransferase RsmA [Planctomycetota bacterium]
MQSKHQIQQLLATAGANPNKRLGQNFLIDMNLMGLLVATSLISRDDVVLEVGCGTGSLTEALSEKAGVCIAVEYDRKLAEIAKKQLADTGNVEIVNCDILTDKHTINGSVLERIQTYRRKCTGRLLLVANLPYQVASPVMINLITGPVQIDAMYVTVQKEVAQRMTADCSGKDYGPLSIFMAAAGDAGIIRILKPTVFWPQPKVDSAMVSFIASKEKIRQIKDFELLSSVVNLFMGHRRKMLKSCTRLAEGSLANIDNWPEIFANCSIDASIRPGQLCPADYVVIANTCYEQTGTK